MPLYKRALEIQEKVLGLENPQTAYSLNNLAMLYRDQDNYSQALPLFKQALAIRKKVQGSEHPDVAYSLNDLAVLYERQGDYSSARPLFKRALEIREKVLGPEHPLTAATASNLVELYQAQGDYFRAGDLYEKRNAKRNAIYNYLLAAEHLAREEFYARACAVVRHVIELDEFNLNALEKLADLYRKMGLTNEALTSYQRLANYAEHLQNPSRAICALERALDLDPGNSSLEEALAELKRKYPRNTPLEGFENFKFDDKDFNFTEQDSSPRVIVCDRCGAKYSLEERKIKATGVSVRCKKCKNIFRVLK